ncbi:MAG: hypothetical protein AAF741_11215 [Bacteroidota bacterium]
MDRSPKTGNGIQEKLMAYAYDSKAGRVLAAATPKNGRVKFDLAPEILENSEVAILPEFPIAPEDVDVARLDKVIAHRPPVLLDTDNNLEVEIIPDYFDEIWRWRQCFVRGRVTKDIVVNGETQTRALCLPIVHICEVDPYWPVLPTIPEYELNLLRDDILRDNLILDIPDNLLEPVPGFPRPLRSFIESGNIQLLEEIRYADSSNFREIIKRDYQIFKPYICRSPYFWNRFLRHDEIAAVIPDKQGRFQAKIPRQYGNDKPDLYFWVEGLVDDMRTTVYKPPVHCSTYWDYNCGREVDIKVTHPDVQINCNTTNLPGEMAWMKRIGNGADIRSIEQQAGADITVDGTLFKTQGLTNFKANELKGDLKDQKVRPFKGTLSLVVQFGSDLPSSNATYYRWSYRKIADANLNPASAEDQKERPLTGRGIHKGYTVEVGPRNNRRFERRQYELGPIRVSDEQLYRIPPVSPNMPDIADDPTAQWNQDTATYYVDTNALRGNGLYEFKLDFFDSNGKLTGLLAKDIEMTSPGNPDVSQSAEVSYLRDGGETPSGQPQKKSFAFFLRVDNSPCEADISPVKVDDKLAGECGFLKYPNDSAGIVFEFKAHQPNGFAEWSLDVTRGYSGAILTAPDDHGSVVGDSEKYELISPGKFRNNNIVGTSGRIAVGTLLTPECRKAAFAQVLHVKALHTDGSSIRRELDARATAAFALEPADE